MVATPTVVAESTIWARVIAPDDVREMSPTAAEEFLKWDFSESDRVRMAVLSAKARAGTLTPEESSEADRYERVAYHLAILQSKARTTLRRSLKS